MPACIRYRPGKAEHCASSCAKHQRRPTSSSRKKGEFRGHARLGYHALIIRRGKRCAIQLINVAVAEKLSALRTENYFSQRATHANLPQALKILRRAGAGDPPIKGDELSSKSGGDKL